MPWHVRIPYNLQKHHLMSGHATACPYINMTQYVL